MARMSMQIAFSAWLPAMPGMTPEIGTPLTQQDIGFAQLLAERSAGIGGIRIAPALTDSAENSRPSIDLRKLADRKAAPLAVAFVATGLLETPGEQPHGSGLEVRSAGRKVRTSSLNLSADLGPKEQRASGAEVNAAHEAAPMSPRSGVSHAADAPLRALSVNRSIAGDADAPSATEPPPQPSEAELGGDGSPDAGAPEQPAEHAARRPRSPLLQRAEAFPVSVTLQAAEEGLKLAVRMAGHAGAGDRVEFERAARRLLAAEGFDLGTIILNGHPHGSARKDQRCS
jgi:hypothetical protein